MYIYIYTYIYIYVYVYVYMYTCIHIFIYVYIHTYIYMCVCIHVHTLLSCSRQINCELHTYVYIYLVTYGVPDDVCKKTSRWDLYINMERGVQNCRSLFMSTHVSFDKCGIPRALFQAHSSAPFSTVPSSSPSSSLLLLCLPPPPATPQPPPLSPLSPRPPCTSARFFRGLIGLFA